MNNLQELIQKRRSVFPEQFNGKPIEKETIQQILEAANWAPTHKRTEPWRFKVVQGGTKNKLGEFLAGKYRETTPKFSELKYQKIPLKFQQSACVIAICMQRDPKESLPEWEEIAATAMAVQNMW
ncbi:MAG TPA: nitroreductase, partial [Flavobacteriaceae bacterium]|nr:nitroreductase [Flavobacteriaceae bacterium]